MTRFFTLLIVASLAYCIGAGISIKQSITAINKTLDVTIETLDKSNQMLREMTDDNDA